MGAETRFGDETKLHEIRLGVFGRKIPENELHLSLEDIEKFVSRVKSEHGKPFADWARNFYIRSLPKTK